MDLKQQLFAAHSMLKGDEIPTMPTGIAQLTRLLNTTEFPDVTEVTELIELNASLSAEMIVMANTSAFKQAGAEEVKTVRSAIEALGMGRLHSVVISLGFKSQVVGRRFDALINHSIDVSRVASALSEYVEEVSAEDAFMAGLFHNAGAIVLAMRFPEYEDYFFSSITNCYSSLDKEIKTYKVSHGVYGLLVAKKWKLPSFLTKVLLIHHQRELSAIPNEHVRKTVALVQLSSCVVSEVSFDSYIGNEVKEMYDRSRAELGISFDDVSVVRKSLMANTI